MSKMSPAAKQHMDARIFRIRTVVSIFDVMNMYGLEYFTAYGSDGSARCPVHGEDNIPSAYIYAESNSIYCHKCQAKWDVIGLVRRMQGGKAFAFMRTLAFIERKFKLPTIPFEDTEYDDDDVEVEDEAPDEDEPVEDEPVEDDPVEVAETQSEVAIEGFEELEEPEVEDEPKELTDDEIQNLMFKHRDWINERLIESRDTVSMALYVKICLALDKSFGMMRRRSLDEAQLKKRLRKVMSKLYTYA